MLKNRETLRAIVGGQGKEASEGTIGKGKRPDSLLMIVADNFEGVSAHLRVLEMGHTYEYAPQSNRCIHTPTVANDDGRKCLQGVFPMGYGQDPGEI